VWLVTSHPRIPPAMLGKDRYKPAQGGVQFVRIPDRYGRPAESGLHVEVRGGDRSANRPDAVTEQPVV